MHKKFGRKQLTTPDCINNINLQLEFLGKFEIEQNGSGWRFLRKKIMDVKVSKLADIRGTSYVELPSK